jgi:hypothetical protein
LKLSIAAISATAIAVVATAVPATGATQAPTKASVNAVGTLTFVNNRFFKEGFHWNKDSYSIRSGGTITLHNLTGGGAPHTFSIVKKSDLPRKIADADKCFSPTGACGKVTAEHQFPEGDGPPKVIRVDGGDGFNKPYDSIVLNSKGERGSTAKVKITAKRGTELYFMCVLHPQMQSEIHVR